ncbi:hypothetical protein ACQUQU_02240 [Thalassolituus sp. LLYu03]|uniref:hypothetical protein n=1 Tax=Thalassolituus sp. LLYu03 TaxID=3421656 RepID=UPI003D2D223A
MSTSTAWSLQDMQPASSAVLRRGSEHAFVVNMPDNPREQGIVGFTPQLSELIDDAWPILWHLLDRQGLSRSLPVYLFYVNPRERIEDNATRLLALMTSLSGKQAVCVPLSTSHAAILHSLRMVLPELRKLRLSGTHWLYIGDSANRRPLEAMARDCRMPFAFHALY